MIKKLMLMAVCAFPFTIMVSGCSGGNNGSTDSPSQPASIFTDVKEAENFVLSDGREVQAAKDEVLIYLKEDVTQAEYDEIISHILNSGATILAFNKDLRILQVQIDSGVSELSFIAETETLEGVNSSGLNEAVTLDSFNDNSMGYNNYTSKPQSIFSLRSVLQSPELKARVSIPSFAGDYWIDHIDLETAWEVEDELPSLSSVTVGIVDTGIPANQAILEESRLTRYNKNGEIISDDDSIGDSGKRSDHGLWTTAFATGFYDESQTTSLDDISRGVSRNSNVIHVDVYERQCSAMLNCFFGGETFTSHVLAGITTAIRNGADVINISWGDNSKCSDTQAQRLASRQATRKNWSSAVAYAKREDRLLLFSSGNNCEKQDNQLLPSTTDLDADSWLTHAVIVGATDSTKTDTLFSRMGNVVNITAPGKDVGYGEDDLDLGWWSNDDTNSGTSFSTPITTGVAAIVKGINGTLSAPEIRHILIDAAEPTVNFADAAAAEYRDYVGANATHPNLMLNAGSAAKTAELTRGIKLDSLSSVSLTKGATQDVNFSIKLPETTVNSLDVVFLIDTSGSYEDDIDTLQQNAIGIINSLKDGGRDVQFGVASYSDFPLSDYGDSLAGDEAYFLNQRITSDVAAVTSAIAELDNPLHHGGDVAESQLEALCQLATGAGRDINGDGDFTDRGELEPNSMGWRTGALRVVFFATDAYFHNSDSESSYPGAGKSETITALQSSGIHVIGLQSGDSSDAQADILSIVNATNGSIHSLSSDSSEIAQAVIDGLNIALAKVDITIEKISGSEWISNITPSSYADVTLGSEVEFTASLSGQKSSSIDELKYDIYLWIRGDGSALLKRIRIPVSVPVKSNGS